MTNTTSVIYSCFFEKKNIPIGLISYWKNHYDLDGIPKLPPFPMRLYRQISLNGLNDYEATIINARNLWNSQNKFLHKELSVKYKLYKEVLQHKYYLNLAYNNGSLKFFSEDIVYFFINSFLV